MTSLAFKLTILMVAAGGAWAEPQKPLTELSGPDQLSRALSMAKHISISGSLPFMKDPANPGKRIEIVSLPCVLEKLEEIKRFTDFLKTAKLQSDPEVTKAFEEGAKLSTAIAVKVVIDEKFSVRILGTDMVIFDHYLTYRAHAYDGRDTYWSYQLALLLARIQKT